MSLTLARVDLTIPNLPAAVAAAHQDSKEGDHQYLCRRKSGSFFVNGVMLLPADRGLQDNTGGHGCLCVEDERREEIIPINELGELYYIVGGDYA